MSVTYSLYDEIKDVVISDLTIDDIVKLTGLTKGTIKNKYSCGMKINRRYTFIYDNEKSITNTNNGQFPQRDLDAWDEICAKFRKYYSKRTVM